MEPKNLDDFAPLLTLDEKKLNKLAAKFSKDKQENRQQNRIYFLSDKLKVIEMFCVKNVSTKLHS